jgi:hypothetical protein
MVVVSSLHNYSLVPNCLASVWRDQPRREVANVKVNSHLDIHWGFIWFCHLYLPRVTRLSFCCFSSVPVTRELVKCREVKESLLEKWKVWSSLVFRWYYVFYCGNHVPWVIIGVSTPSCMMGVVVVCYLLYIFTF